MMGCHAVWVSEQSDLLLRAVLQRGAASPVYGQARSIEKSVSLIKIFVLKAWTYASRGWLKSWFVTVPKGRMTVLRGLHDSEAMDIRHISTVNLDLDDDQHTAIHKRERKQAKLFPFSLY